MSSLCLDLDFTTRQQKYQATYVERLPDLCTSHRTAAHMESLAMELDEYLAKHSQVWESTTATPGTRKPEFDEYSQSEDDGESLEGD